MKELREFVAREHKWAQIFGNTVEIATAKGRKDVAGRIDSQLSPENLSCDGELSAQEVNRRFRFLTKAAEQLLKLDPSVEIHEYY